MHEDPFGLQSQLEDALAERDQLDKALDMWIGRCKQVERQLKETQDERDSLRVMLEYKNEQLDLAEDGIAAALHHVKALAEGLRNVSLCPGPLNVDEALRSLSRYDRWIKDMK